jgi:hypothetical protein
MYAEQKAGGEAIAKAEIQLGQCGGFGLGGRDYDAAALDDGVDGEPQFLLEGIAAAEPLEVFDDQQLGGADFGLPIDEAFFGGGGLELAAEVGSGVVGDALGGSRLLKHPAPVSYDRLGELRFSAAGGADEHQRIEQAGGFGQVVALEQSPHRREQQRVLGPDDKRRSRAGRRLIKVAAGEFEFKNAVEQEGAFSRQQSAFSQKKTARNERLLAVKKRAPNLLDFPS